MESDPDRPCPAEPDETRRLQDYVATWLPGLDATRPRPVGVTSTSTPDGEVVLECHGPLVVGAGLSAHGFEHAPVVGETVAALATNRAPASVPG